MHRRTFEVLAKYISHEFNITVKFDQPGTAKANLLTNEIHMPEKISGDNALAALALLMHEAAHLKYTKYLPLDKILVTRTDQIIHNVIEDVRIDLHNFNKLPNIKEFYRQLYKKCGKVEDEKGPLKMKALIACIDYLEGFRNKFDDNGIRDLVFKDGLASAVQEGVYAGDCNQPKDVKDAITKIKKILQIDDSKEPKLQFIKVSGNSQNGGKDFVKVKDGEGEGAGDGSNEIKGADQGRDPGGKSWGDGTTMSGADAHISDIALEAQTTQAFKELLSIKERREVYDGNVLNTDELMSYFTGDIETLFKDETVIKCKKSKIMFLMDCSGSMSDKTICCTGDSYTSRADVVAACVKKIISIIEEVRQTESLDVDWAVSMFDGSYTPLTKDTWEKAYGCHGGTYFAGGMKGAIEDLMKDYTIEGKRIIVAFSDGDVGQHDIDAVKEAMQRTGSDIRYLVIGVGCPPGSPMTQGLIGDRVILGKDDANVVLLDTLKDLIE